MWLHLRLIQNMKQFCETIYPSVAYGYCTIPTYPSGQIGFMMCSKNLVTFVDNRSPAYALKICERVFVVIFVAILPLLGVGP